MCRWKHLFSTEPVAEGFCRKAFWLLEGVLMVGAVLKEEKLQLLQALPLVIGLVRHIYPKT